MTYTVSVFVTLGIDAFGTPPTSSNAVTQPEVVCLIFTLFETDVVVAVSAVIASAAHSA